MKTQLADTCCARLPATALPHLSALRASREVSGLNAGEWLWLFWPAGQDELACAIQAILGAELFLRREGAWHRPGEHLPVFHTVPNAQLRPGRSRRREALPGSGDRLFPPGTPEWRPAPSRTACAMTGWPDLHPRCACRWTELGCWADSARPAISLQDLASNSVRRVRFSSAAHDCRPWSTESGFWGRRVFVPLGFPRVDPNLMEGVLVSALGLQEGRGRGIHAESGVEIVPGSAFAPITARRSAPRDGPREAPA